MHRMSREYLQIIRKRIQNDCARQDPMRMNCISMNHWLSVIPTSESEDLELIWAAEECLEAEFEYCIAKYFLRNPKANLKLENMWQSYVSLFKQETARLQEKYPGIFQRAALILGRDCFLYPPHLR